MKKRSRAKLFRNGGSQAVRLPRDCRFPEGQREVVARREGRRVILELPDEWPLEFRECLGGWTGPIPRPPRRPVAGLRDPHRIRAGRGLSRPLGLRAKAAL